MKILKQQPLHRLTACPLLPLVEVNVTFEWWTNTGVIEASIGLCSVICSHIAGCLYGYGCHRSSFLLLTARVQERGVCASRHRRLLLSQSYVLCNNEAIFGTPTHVNIAAGDPGSSYHTGPRTNGTLATFMLHSSGDYVGGVVIPIDVDAAGGTFTGRMPDW